jgi:hypothetical protein
VRFHGQPRRTGEDFRRTQERIRVGRGVHNHHAANSASQQLSISAHKLTVGFQLHADLAGPQPRSPKRTYAYKLSSIKTLRFSLIHPAARSALIRGCGDLHLSHNAQLNFSTTGRSTALAA